MTVSKLYLIPYKLYSKLLLSELLAFINQIRKVPIFAKLLDSLINLSNTLL